jgi:hypothetical protein
MPDVLLRNLTISGFGRPINPIDVQNRFDQETHSRFTDLAPLTDRWQPIKGAEEEELTPECSRKS